MTYHNPNFAPPDLLALNENQCRYPLTDAHPHSFCGAPTARRKSYCPTHHALCLTPPGPPPAPVYSHRPTPPGITARHAMKAAAGSWKSVKMGGAV